MFSVYLSSICIIKGWRELGWEAMGKMGQGYRRGEKGAQTTKHSFVVCALGSRCVCDASRALGMCIFFVYLLILITYNRYARFYLSINKGKGGDKGNRPKRRILSRLGHMYVFFSLHFLYTNYFYYI